MRSERSESGPPVSFSKDPKGHLDVFSDLPEDILGYVTFIVFASHTSEDRLPAIVPMLQGFRSFLGYHIKASSHTFMRTRVSSLLDELKGTRADSGVKKEKKTMSGRTFKGELEKVLKLNVITSSYSSRVSNCCLLLQRIRSSC